MGTTPTSDAESHRDPMHAFAELALITVDGNPPAQTLRRIAELAKQTLDGAEDVSLTVVEEGHPRTTVFTGPLAVDLDERQYDLGFGPCLDAAKTGQTLVLDTTDEHFPYPSVRPDRRAGRRQVHGVIVAADRSTQHRWAERLLHRRLSTVRCFRRVGRDVRRLRGGGGQQRRQLRRRGGRGAAGLRTAMATPAVIEQAKGILMARDHCTADEAFDLLKRLSSHRNLKLRDIAQAIVEQAQK